MPGTWKGIGEKKPTNRVAMRGPQRKCRQVGCGGNRWIPVGFPV